MRWLDIVLLWMRSLVGQRKLDEELDEELAFFLEKRMAELVRAGFTPADARRAALLELGPFELCKEECRDARHVRYLQETWRDICFAARLLRKAPGFTFLGVSTLGLVLAANATVFAGLNALLLMPLPYGTPENRLVLVWENFGTQGLAKVPFSAPEVHDLQRAIPSFQEAAAFRHDEDNVTQNGAPERVYGAVVSWNLFSVLGVGTKLGRVFSAEDADATERVVVISETLWARRFASDPNIIGQPISLSGRRFTVVGVMPGRFRFPPALFNARGPMTGAAEIWKPMRIAEAMGTERSSRIYGMVACVNSTLSQVNGDLARRREVWEKDFPGNYAGRNFGLRAALLRTEIAGRMRLGMLLAGAAVFILLLITLTNLVVLLLARARSRERELAVRIALGAGTGRLLRQFLAEGTFFALLGGAVAVIVTGGAIAFWRTAIDPALSLGGNIRLDGSVALCLLALCALSGLLLGFIPGWKMIAPRQANRLAISHRTLRTSCWHKRLRDALVTGEIALAVILLVAAGLLTKSSRNLRSAPLGFNSANVVTAEISLPSLKYPTETATAEFFSKAAGEIERVSGVTAAGFTSVLPLSGINQDKSFTIEDDSPANAGRVPDEEFRIVTPGYFAALEIPLLHGRVFTTADTAESPPVVVINQALARRYWTEGDALGKRLRLNQAPVTWLTIIGVVGDLKHRGLDEPARPELYLPHAQVPSGLMTLVARIGQPPEKTAQEITARIQSIDPEQAVAHVRTMEQVVAHSARPHRFVVLLVGLSALMAVLLGITGVHSVTSSLFVERKRDIAMRIALGAPRRAILKMIYHDTVRLVAGGTFIGLLSALGASQTLRPLLYGVRSRDPATFFAVVVLLAGIGIVATLVPARRAAQLDAMPLLRCD